MQEIVSILLIGVSLSMDTFSLSLSVGSINSQNGFLKLLPLFVGIFHFFMPLLGLNIGNFLLVYFVFNINIVVGIIFSIIGLEMIISSIKESDVKILLSMWGLILFGFSVSLDSLTTGIGLKAINDNFLEVSSIFMICSGFFTFIGLKLGNKLSNKFGKIATIGGVGMLIILAIYYVFR